MDDAQIVEVEVNMQQMQLLEQLCAAEGLAGPSEALRNGLAAYLSGQAEAAA